MNREPRRQRTYFILLLVTAFALLTIDYHSNGTGSPLHPLEKAVAGVVGPGETAVSSLVRPITDQVHFGKQPDRVAELQKELDAAKSLAETSQNDHRQVEQFDKLMGWPPYYVMKMKPGRVVAAGDTLSNDSSVTLDMGTHDGLHINMTVVSGLGLIGNVIKVDRTTCTVQLLVDPDIYVQVRNSRTNVEGYVQGRADGRLLLTQISQTSDIKVGDNLVTKGSENNQPYVPDIPVGKVVSVETVPGSATHGAVVQPFASFDALDILFVIFPPSTPVPHGFLIPPITATPTTAPPSPTTPGTSAPAVGSNPPASGGVTSAGVTSGSVTTTSSRTTTGAPVTTTSAAPTTPAPPTSRTPTSKPPTSKPPTSKPATSKPPTSKPATSKPATSKPATSKPVTRTTTAAPTTPLPPPASPVA